MKKNKILIPFFLLLATSCNEEFVLSLKKGGQTIAHTQTYDLNVYRGARVLYMYKFGADIESVYIENNQIYSNDRVLPDLEVIAQIESYNFNNASTANDRFYYISDTGTLKYSFDGISSVELLNRPVFNSLNHNLISETGLLFHENLLIGTQIGDAHYFSTKRNSVERIVDRLGLVDGSMQINHASVSDNYTEDFCINNPASCSSTPYKWVSKVLMLSDDKTAVGIISRLVTINGTPRLIPYHSFRMDDSSIQMKPISSGFTIREREILADINLMDSFGRSRIYRDQDRIAFNYRDTIQNKLYFFSIDNNDSEIKKNHEIIGDLPTSFNYSHTYSHFNEEDDMAEWLRYPTARYSTASGERFDFLVGGSWRTSASFNSFLTNENNFIKLHKDKKSGWNFKMRTPSAKKVVWCDDNFDNCTDVIIQGYSGHRSIFLSDKGAYVIDGDMLIEYQGGAVARSYVFADSATGGNLSAQILFFREGSFCVLRMNNDPSDKEQMLYLFNEKLERKQVLAILQSETSNPSLSPAASAYTIGYMKVALGIFGIYFTPP